MDRGRDFDDDAREFGPATVHAALEQAIWPEPDNGHNGNGGMSDADWQRRWEDLPDPLDDPQISSTVHALPSSDTFALCDLATWATIHPEPKAFAVERIIPMREVTLASGVGGGNKSLFGQQLCTCYATLIPMLGLATAGGSSLYATAEDDESQLHWRLAHICNALKIPMESLIGKLHLASLRGQLVNQLATFTSDGRMSLTPAFHRLRATIAATKAALIVLDNVAHLFGGNENDRIQVTAFVNAALYGLVNEFGCSIVLIAHKNKSGDDYSGSTAWLNAVRSHIVIGRPDDEPDPDVRTLRIGKANYARTGDEIRFRWHDFALILEDELPTDTRAEMAANAAANHDNEIFLACLTVRNRQQRRVSDAAGKAYAPAVFAEMVESKGVGKKRLEQAMERLFRVGMIETGYLWKLDGKERFGLRLTDANAPPTLFANESENSANGRQRAVIDTPTPANTHEDENSANGRHRLTPTVANTPAPLKGGMGAAPRADAPNPSNGTGDGT